MLALALLAVALYRMYGPGDLAERLGRLKTRWAPFYEPEMAGNVWLFIGRGLLVTLEIAVLSIVLSIVFGIVLALMRLARNERLGIPLTKPARFAISAPSTVIVQSVRSSPLFLLILFTYLAAPKLGFRPSPFTAGVVVLTVYTSCILAEIVRAGVLALDRGQFEAADSLGLGYLKKTRLIVLPQALRRMIPSIVSQLVTLIKDTSLLNVITVFELTRRLHVISQTRFNPIESYFVAGAIYFVINFTLSSFARRLELRPTRAAAAAPAVQGIGVEDQTVLAK